MPNVVRLGDAGTSVHPSCVVPVPITSITANGNEVYANGILISTDTDLNSPHGPHGPGSGCPPGSTPYTAGAVSQTVFIGSLGVARINDQYSCTGIITSGSPDVYAGG
jgi:hypothetical protein